MKRVVKNCGQQGDVRLLRVSDVPNGAIPVKRQERGYILAEGEATGHAHVITKDIELYEHDGVLYLKNEQEVTIQHEEHKPVTLSPGTWRVGRVREKDMLEGFARQVVD
jgi:hypothetical protein